jgi:hypothetical protein
MRSGAGRGAAARVFVHVGSPKTGTTFLQNLLWSHRDLAREQGLHLPMTRFRDHYLATLDVRGLAGSPPYPTRAVGMWKRLADDALATPGTSLISHELFAGATAEQARQAMERLAGDAEVHLVITARDLVRQVTAEWQEHVKHRSRQSLGDFVAAIRRDDAHKSWFWRVQDFADLAQRWGGGLPPSRIHVVTVPPPGSPGNLLWERFAGLLDLDPASFETTRARSNESLGLEQTELLRRVNEALGDRLPIPGPYPAVVKEILAHKVLAGRPGTSLTLADADVEFAAERSRDIVARLQAMGVDIVGDPADLVPPSAPSGEGSAGEAYASPPAELLLEESVAALADVLVELTGRRNRAERLAFAEKSPVRFALVRASERHPVLRKARTTYRRLQRR